VEDPFAKFCIAFLCCDIILDRTRRWIIGFCGGSCCSISVIECNISGIQMGVHFDCVQDNVDDEFAAGKNKACKEETERRGSKCNSIFFICDLD